MSAEGGFTVRLYGGLVIYSDLMSCEEFKAAELRLGADEREAEEMARRYYGSPHSIGYGYHYSVACVDGEPGALPRLGPDELRQVSQGTFEAAKARGWDLWPPVFARPT